MPAAAHEIAIKLLAEQPELLSQLTEKVLGRQLPKGVRVVDSTLRFVNTEEAKPDLVIEHEAGWAAVEVQSQVDPEKQARWPVMMSVKANQTGRMGDLLVLTSSRAVAEWATEVAQRTGPLGTQLSVRPVVVMLAGATIETLLDDERPALAFFAAWAMQDRHGPEARRVVDRALKVSERLPIELQLPMQSAIMGVLNEKMLSYLRERAMNLRDIPLGGAAKLLWEEARAEGEAVGRVQGEAVGRVRGEAVGRMQGKADGLVEGRAEAVLAVLAARAVAVTDAQRDQILSCRDGELVTRYLRRAVTAATADDILGLRSPQL